MTGLIRMLGPVSKFNQRVYGFDVKATDRHGDDDGRSAIANVFVSFNFLTIFFKIKFIMLKLGLRFG